MANQNLAIDILESLSPEEFAKLPGLTSEEIRMALKQGEDERRTVEDAGAPAMALPQMLFR
jgi:hypothetical protein